MKKPVLLVVAIISMMLVTTVNSTAQQKKSNDSKDSLVIVQKLIQDAVATRKEISAKVTILEQFIAIKEQKFDSLHDEFKRWNPDSIGKIYDGPYVSEEQELKLASYMKMREEKLNLITNQMKGLSLEKKILDDQLMKLQTRNLELSDFVLENYAILLKLKDKEENKN